MTRLSHDDRTAWRAAAEVARARAVARRDGLERDLTDLTERGADAVRDDEHDPEGQTIAWERAQAASLAEAARERIRDLDDAIRRSTDGAARCGRCDEPIPIERLLVRPDATTCVSCSS